MLCMYVRTANSNVVKDNQMVLVYYFYDLTNTIPIICPYAATVSVARFYEHRPY